MGTPDIARVCLQHVLEADEDDVRLVLCQPDRPQGRGKRVVAPPVKQLAEARGIEVLQPTKLKDGIVAQRLIDEQIDLALVVAYGRILPRAVFEAPTFGSWNVHASLLPRHRGAAPIQRAILAGDEETGVDLMIVGEGLDEGDVLLERRLPLTGQETGGALTEALAELGGQILVDGLRRAKTEGLTQVPQAADGVTYATKVEKREGRLDLSQPAVELHRQIRAFDPWPGTFVSLTSGQSLKILEASVVEGDRSQPAGTILRLKPDLVVNTGDAALLVHRLQPAGKKPMIARDFLNGSGRHLRVGTPLVDS